MTKIDLHSTFFPGQHIDDPKWFGGRRSDLEKALKTLCSPGASMIVFGERGVGKSSFVEMIKQIATGDPYLIIKHKLHKIYPPDKFKFKIVAIECDAETETTSKVLQRLITSPDGIKSLISSRIDKVESLSNSKLSLDILKIFGAGYALENKITETSFKEESTFELFTNLILTISKNILAQNEGLLIVIDEFDLVLDSYKMASLIKTLSKNNVKFLLSGIAESYDQLLLGHQSIARQLVYGRINITPMTLEETTDIFDIISKNYNNAIRFEPSFIKEVWEKSKGFPYFVQLFGQLSLDNYAETTGLNQTPMIIHNKYLRHGLKKFAHYEYQMEKDYLSIIKENALKESMLKFMARHLAKKIKDEEIFSFCYKSGVQAPLPKNTLSSLLAHRDPHFLVRENDNSDYVYFIDPLFKVYANSREPELINTKSN